MAVIDKRIIRPFSLQTGDDCQPAADLSMLTTPGDVITNDTDYMRSVV